jgi:hypothetical protein
MNKSTMCTQSLEFGVHTIAILVIVLYTTGCGEPTKSTATVAVTTATGTLSITETPSPTRILPTLTASPLPSPTLLPSASFPRLTYTPVPTLSPGEWEAYWLNLISTNDGCELPCWWGVKPGESTPRDILNFLTPLGVHERPPNSYRHGDSIYEFALDVNQKGILNLSLVFYERAGTVLSITVSSDMVILNGSPAFTEAMKRYSLNGVLAHYGKPTRVLVGLRGGPSEPSAPWLYSIWVFYDNLGMLIYYEGEGLSRKGQTLRVCPNYDGIWYIDLYLQSPSSTNLLEDLQALKSQFTIEEQIAEGYLRPLEESTNLSLAAFYELFVKPGSACFESPASAW